MWCMVNVHLKTDNFIYVASVEHLDDSSGTAGVKGTIGNELTPRSKTTTTVASAAHADLKTIS